MGFTSLAYLMDIDWLCGAFYRTRKDGAPGVDGQTWDQYAENLEANLQSLLDRAKSGTYRAPPVRRVYIPKAGSTTELRPIGIPTLEDKVLQHAPFLWPKAIFTRHPSQPNLTLPPLQHARPKISRRAPLKPPWPKAILTVAWGTRPRNPQRAPFLWPKAIFTRLPPQPIPFGSPPSSPVRFKWRSPSRTCFHCLLTRKEAAIGLARWKPRLTAKSGDSLLVCPAALLAANLILN